MFLDSLELGSMLASPEHPLKNNIETTQIVVIFSFLSTFAISVDGVKGQLRSSSRTPQLHGTTRSAKYPPKN